MNRDFLLNLSDNNDDLLNILKTNGRSKNPEDINLLYMYYEKYGKLPHVFQPYSDDNNYYDWDILTKKLKDYYKDSEIVYKNTYYDIDKNKKYSKHEVWHIKDNLMFHIEGGLSDDFYLINHKLDNVERISSDVLFLHNGNFSEQEEKDIVKIFTESQIEENKKVTIGMISVDNGDFYVKDFDIIKNIIDLEYVDLHYGDGFEEFLNNLLHRLKTVSKGLTLFHGNPGTGKTTVIRHIIKKIKEDNLKNNVLYFPPTMIDSITDPGFINFISDWVADSDGKNYLLIEDAEPLLESRDQSRNIGITNLLNLTDGLLNDILNIQIIATFNTSLKNIDKALLRPERLIARKEFNDLDMESAKLLCDKIGIDSELIKKDMTLADIYAMKKESKPITHGMSKEKKIGFQK